MKLLIMQSDKAISAGNCFGFTKGSLQASCAAKTIFGEREIELEIEREKDVDRKIFDDFDYWSYKT